MTRRRTLSLGRTIVIGVLLAVLVAVGGRAVLADGPAPVRPPAHVVRVVDGDTLIASFDGRQERVRLIGIDAPETTGGKNECQGLAATQALTWTVGDRDVVLVSDPTQTDRDRYDRLLRYVELDGSDVGADLVRRGLAHEYTYRAADPYQRQESYRMAQGAARADQDGGWSECGWQ